ncbi:MAG: hemerythrin domain-containing protein [Bryobacteraceae bacterium]|nr:hemerythrin domain-containing protein [Solibacteraceae bacterium]MCO5352627.1 hemerythrin domain-containing protein [Bryobacteraceae bacterium]
MNLVDALRGEHGVIRGMLLRLVREEHELSAAAVTFGLALLEEALASHSMVEDDLLFDGLLTPKPGVAQVLASMRNEHTAIRSSLANLSRTRHQFRRGPMASFAELVLEHFAVEERVLFPMAQSLLSPDELEAAGRQWAKRRNVQMEP